MDTARFLRLRRLFDYVVNLSMGEREKVLAELAASDPEMGQELGAYLLAHDGAGSLEQTPRRDAPPMHPVEPSAHPPRHIGSYRILKRMGGGGMGEVFQAVRDDGAFRKYVALKLIREEFIREPQAVERFQAERQVLAALEHPYIARILDGGSTEGGAPYYVMELVEGQPLDEFCNEKKLDVEKRLVLMRQICEAVHYLHSNQVVHRDLKPSNIFVTHAGVPKILDFGIAKILGPVAPDLSALYGSPLTPSYASPEQLHGRTVTGASDVFTLGIISYQLLAGKLPDRLKMVPPSAALSNENHRLPESDTQLRRKIGGDLDKVVMRALETDPADRYRSAEELSADIGRYLDHRTVLATKASVARKAAKFASRNRVAVAVGAAMLMLAVTTAGLVWRNSSLEARMRSISQPIERLTVPASAQNVEGILNDLRLLEKSLRNPLLQDESLPPDQLSRRAALLQRSVMYLGGLEAFAPADLRVAKGVAAAYVQVAELQNNEQKPRLSDRSSAVASYVAAARQYVRVAAVEPQNPDIHQRLENVERRLTRLEARVPPEVIAILHPPLKPEILTNPVPAPEPDGQRRTQLSGGSIKPTTVSVQAGEPVRPTMPATLTRATDAVPLAMPPQLEELSMDTKTKADAAESYYLTRKAELAAQGLSPRADMAAAFTQMKSRLEQARRQAEAGKLQESAESLRAARELAGRIQQHF